MRPWIFLAALIFVIPVPVRADDYFVEDDMMTELPKQVSEVIYNTEGKNLLVDFRNPKSGPCKLIGKPIDLVPSTKSGYFATTANACNWGAATGPIWLVLKERRPVVVLSYGGASLALEKQMQNGLPNIVISAGTAGWSTKTWFRYDGAKYIESKSEQCTAQEDSSFKCSTPHDEVVKEMSNRVETRPARRHPRTPHDEVVKEVLSVPLHQEATSGPATAATQFAITIENLEAIKPTRIAIASITPTNTGAKIVAFTNMNGAVSTFMRQMQQAGAASVTLHQLRPITACGKQLSRVEIEIYGDNSRLVAHNSQNEQVDITLDVNSVSSEKFKCTVPVGQ
jgi:hypothetical protein